MQCAAHEPLYDIDPRTGDAIEVFYADRELETFGRCGAGWFWWSRRRGFSPELCLSEFKHVHTNDGVRREIA
jgi:hypothetical protein